MTVNVKKYKILQCYMCPRHIDYQFGSPGQRHYCNEAERSLRLGDYSIPEWCPLGNYHCDRCKSLTDTDIERIADADSG
jgi:hypothetical protein